MAALHFTSGPLAGQRVEVEHELVIGRADADVTVDDAELSRRHLAVRPVSGALEVEDLGSTNGTFVDYTRIRVTTRLADGAKVKLGSTIFVVEGVAPVQTTRVSAQVADVEATRVRNVAASPTRASPVPAKSDVAATRARPQAPPAPAAGSSVTAPATGGRARTPATFGTFTPSSSRRGGLASRSWIPVALSFGSVIATAAALVIYFAAR